MNSRLAAFGLCWTLLSAGCGSDQGSSGTGDEEASAGTGGTAGATFGTGGNSTGGTPLPATGGAAPTTGGTAGTAGTNTGGMVPGGTTSAGGSSGSGASTGDASVPLDDGGAQTDAGTLDAGNANGSQEGGNDDAGSSGSGDGAPPDGGYSCLGITGPSTFPAVADFAERGPFDTESVPDDDTSLGGPACTIFRPTGLRQSTYTHPVILWGNGTFAVPAYYAEALDHWASHGFIVAAADTSNAGTGAEMLACLDYLTAENTRNGSAYLDKVDLSRIGASGHSQGGGGSVMAGADPRVITTAPLQPWFGFSDAANRSQQTGPMFIMSGSEDTIAVPAIEQEPLYQVSNVPTVWGTLQGADHVVSAIGNITGYRGPSTAWFRFVLMHDMQASRLFCDPDYLLDAAPEWDMQRKNFY